MIRRPRRTVRPRRAPAPRPVPRVERALATLAHAAEALEDRDPQRHAFDLTDETGAALDLLAACRRALGATS